MNFVKYLRCQVKYLPHFTIGEKQLIKLHFCESKKGCQAKEYAIRDHIVIVTTNDPIRKKAMLKNWNLIDLRTNSMKYKVAAAGEEKYL